MYKVQLEVELYFIPPMKEGDPGVALIKTIELPFPPVPELGLVGESLEAHPFPPGLVIKELSWDVDKQVFLAKTADHMLDDFSLEELAFSLAEWHDLGWTEGALQDAYEQEHEEEEPPDVTPAEALRSWCHEDPVPRVTSPPDRAAAFRACLRGMVRLMVKAHNNLAVAYAMDKTGCMLTDSSREKVRPRVRRRWDDMIKQFDLLTYKRRAPWIKKVEKYTPLQDVPGVFDLEL